MEIGIWCMKQIVWMDLNALDDLFENSTDGSGISNLIDDDIASNSEEQVNTLALYNTQIADECDFAIQTLKRKFC